MTTRQAQVGAWVVQADAELQETEAAKEASAAFQAARRRREAIERAWAGARIAKVFREWPWLAAVTLSFAVTSEYDDQGGTMRSVSISVSNPESLSGAPLPDLMDDEEFDLDVAAAILQVELQDEAYPLYAALEDEYSFEDVDVTVRREPLGHLLEQPEMDGAAAFMALFPELASSGTAVDSQAGVLSAEPLRA